MSDAPTMPASEETVNAALIGCTDGLDRAELYGNDKGFAPSMSVYFRKPWSTYFGPHWENAKIKLPRGMYGRDGKLQEIGRLLMTGISDRAVSRLAGVHRDTVGKLRRIMQLEMDMPIRCRCGKPSNHRGFCTYRVRASRARQEFLKRWTSQGHRKATAGRRVKLNRVEFAMTKRSNAEVSDGGPLTHKSPAAQSRRSLH